MPQLRTDWLTGRTVFVAENRAERPNEFAAEPVPRSAANGRRQCPFCPGHEAETPPATYEQLGTDGAWSLRVIPNKYPAVSLDGDVFADDRTAAVGVHEVIIESPRHVDRTSELCPVELARVLNAYANRLNRWRADERLAYGLVFKNQGPRAGASLAHLHSQLMALPTIPAAVQSELERAVDAAARSGSCEYCRIIADERAASSRVVLDRDGYVAFCPYVSLQPCEVWLMPSEHRPSFEESLGGDEAIRLGGVLYDVIRRVEVAIPDASYNLLLRTAPWRAGCDNYYHWRIELLPRLNSIAGFEAATNIYINAVPPERAAARLRSI